MVAAKNAVVAPMKMTKVCVRGQLEQWREPRHHEHARRHHGGGVNQRRDRRRPFHGIGKPGVQQELRRFSHRPHEQKETDQRERIHVPGQEVNGLAGERWRLRENGVEVDRAGHQEHREDAERKAEIADAIDDEGLDGGGVRLRLLVPETDEQIAHQPDALPAEKQLHEIVRRHQHQHGEGEQ
jgi:hypothetical protein